ncbi:hypothetical protein [Streptomyces sp. NPDC001401]|uniref:hypothetical protein n=1 Tax=Streptomyces sp. NPDC001401 TaxID=3364570 RepID=UPI0036B1115A
MNELIWNRATMTPLTSPMSTPVATAASTAVTTPTSWRAMSAAHTRELVAAFAPREKSK